MPQAQLLLAQERFLFRLAQVDEEKNLIWKGGSLILRRYTEMKPPRFTADIDLLVQGLAFTDGEELIHQALKIDLHDGFEFGRITKSPMERETPYGGERFEISWTFQGKPNSEALKIDLCAGDDVDPEKIDLADVYLLDDDASHVTISVYPPEFIYAEKLETMVRFATGNTRLKDFIDLWSLSKSQTQALSENLRDAVKRCFARRKTKLDPSEWQKILLDEDFQELMEGARKRNFPKLEIPPVPKLFNEVADYLKAFDPWT
jgi:predicted nucleotidyltransferase component of viral defense system